MATDQRARTWASATRTLSVIITVVIVIALFHLVRGVVPLVLGVVYRLLRERDDRIARADVALAGQESAPAQTRP